MKTFSVEGMSPASFDEAIGDAMAKAQGMARDSGKLDVVVAAVVKDGNVFRVTINVIAHPPEGKSADEKGGGDDTARDQGGPQTRQAANDSRQQLDNELLYHHSHRGSFTVAPEDVYEMGWDTIEASPDTSSYARSMAEEQDASSSHSPATPVFDVVQEQRSEHPSSSGETRVAVLAREVDDIIGLLSLGFYDPPRPVVAANDTFMMAEPDPRRRDEPDPREIPPPPAPDKEQPAPRA